jgi:hypothetical protein
MLRCASLVRWGAAVAVAGWRTAILALRRWWVLLATISPLLLVRRLTAIR